MRDIKNISEIDPIELNKVKNLEKVRIPFTKGQYTKMRKKLKLDNKDMIKKIDEERKKIMEDNIHG